eukprot:GHVH01009272.1.p1 GENE.GHVH01009272.1~~GHVH01009272.1.p1  ORF type:complete len:564 (+),score=74.01 GHVH01009272.1:2948-4639(+)
MVVYRPRVQSSSESSSESTGRAKRRWLRHLNSTNDHPSSPHSSSSRWKGNHHENLLFPAQQADECQRPSILDQVCCRLAGGYLNMDSEELSARTFAFTIGPRRFLFRMCEEKVQCTGNLKMRSHELVDIVRLDVQHIPPCGYGDGDRKFMTLKLGLSRAEEEAEEVVRRSLSNAVVVTFNWFNPSGIVEYFTLGRRLLDPHLVQLMPEEYPKVAVGDIYKEVSETFYHTTGVERLLKRVKKEEKTMIVCGFSLGGSISLCVSIMMDRVVGDASAPIRVVTFGAPRTGNLSFGHLCKQKLHPESANYVLTCGTKQSTDVGGGYWSQISDLGTLMCTPGSVPDGDCDSDAILPLTSKGSHAGSQEDVEWALPGCMSANVDDKLFRGCTISDTNFICAPNVGSCFTGGDNEPVIRNQKIIGTSQTMSDIVMNTLYDPVCISQPSLTGAGTHGEDLLEDTKHLSGQLTSYASCNPFTKLFLQELGMWRWPGTEDYHNWRSLEATCEYSVKNQSLLRTFGNFIARRSPFNERYNIAFNRLHSISTYYSAMLGLDASCSINQSDWNIIY